MFFCDPIKMPRGSHFGSEYYIMYSPKLGRMVTAYSKLEFFNILTLEVDPEVETYCEQPCEISVLLDGSLSKAVFDMWVLYRDGREELQEVKYSKDLTGDSASAIRSQEQIRREKHWCEESGIPFVLRTEHDLNRGEYWLQNLNVVAGLVRRYIPSNAEYYNKLILRYLHNAIFDKRKKVLVNDLLEKDLLPIGSEWDHLAYMYVRGMIGMNIVTQPLSRRTEIRLYAKED